MIALLSLLFSIYYSSKKKSLPYLILYQLLIICALSTLVANGVDVTYKLDLSRPSDTAMYYKTYIDLNSDINQNIFPFFIYYLRIIEFPFHNAIFVVWGQSVITFLLIDLCVQNKRNLLFICLFHALIYTNAGMFKDNFIIIIALITYLILTKIKNTIIQIIIISGCVILLSKVRPFLYQFLIPLSIIPLWTHIKSPQLKKFTLITIVIAGTIVWIMMQTYISGIVRMFENDSSVLAGRASPPLAIIKIIAGPTPLHYLFSDEFMVQPFSKEQSVLYCLYHLFYYYVLTFWLIYLVTNLRHILYAISNNVPKLLLVGLGAAQGLVYVVIYGSADIRQRAIIILFIFISSLYKKNIFLLNDTINNRISLYCLFSILTIITIINS